MRVSCRKCELEKGDGSDFRLAAKFYRKSDGRWIQRYRCNVCRAGFSDATFDPCYRQKKRHKNLSLYRLLCSGLSMRRSARILFLNRTTVVRKFLFLSVQARVAFLVSSQTRHPLSKTIEFDDLETFEHSKYKPLSVTLAVDSDTRRILGVEVSRMPPKGRLARKAAERYGPRFDERSLGRDRLFRDLRDLVEENALIRSDSNPHYPATVKKFFPEATHETVRSRRAAVTGQGELKQGVFDPIFSLNHTCAKLRDDIKRLARRTWCTTKRADRLQLHLYLYARFHNEELLPKLAQNA